MHLKSSPGTFWLSLGASFRQLARVEPAPVKDVDQLRSLTASETAVRIPGRDDGDGVAAGHATASGRSVYARPETVVARRKLPRLPEV